MLACQRQIRQVRPMSIGLDPDCECGAGGSARSIGAGGALEQRSLSATGVTLRLHLHLRAIRPRSRQNAREVMHAMHLRAITAGERQIALRYRSTGRPHARRAHPPTRETTRPDAPLAARPVIRPACSRSQQVGGAPAPSLATAQAARDRRCDIGTIDASTPLALIFYDDRRRRRQSPTKNATTPAPTRIASKFGDPPSLHASRAHLESTI